MTNEIVVDELKSFIGKFSDDAIIRLENFIINKTNFSKAERIEFFEILSSIEKK